MSIYYLIGMVAMFGLGYRVGVAFERIRFRAHMVHGGVRLFRVNAEGTIVGMDDEDREDDHE